ncbi:phage tail protein [Bacillus sp. C1-1]|nr:phage tail protein [Bacillus sp. C1-1]
MFGIFFNGQHSYRDLGLTVADRDVGDPQKIKTIERVPYSNELYDFSTLYGDQQYSERSLTYVFNVKDYDKINLSFKKVEVTNWLMSLDHKSKLLDDNLPNYYFTAELEDEPNFDELKYHGRLSVTFTAKPFMVSELEEGHDIWDDFNFLLDYALTNKYQVNGRLDTDLYNGGSTSAIPLIKASAPMQIIKGNVTFQVPAGETKDIDFSLAKGSNLIRIVGNGSISFHFHKGVI